MIEDTCGSTNDDATRKGGVEEMLYSELTLKAAASREGDETAASQREDGIGDNLVFGVDSVGEVTKVD